MVLQSNGGIMPKWFLVLALVVMFFAPVAARAQGEASLASVSVEIWPEYDKPAVLIIEHITLAAATELPVTLAIRVPAQAEVNAVAINDSRGGLVYAPYERQVQGQWAVLTLKSNSSNVQIEYYDPLIKDGARRHVVYVWPGDYAADTLLLRFQQPVGATNFVITPVPTGTSVGTDDLTYASLNAGPLAAGETFTLSADYQKETDNLSISGRVVEPVEPLGSDTSGRLSLTRLLPWILGGLLAILAIGGVVAGLWYWQSKRGGDPASRQRHAKRLDAAKDTHGVIHCHQCGRRAQPGDQFCRACGTRLRHKA